MKTHASLFSGIGGPEVAAAMLGWENAFHCEINPFGRVVLEYWFPESKSYEDITKTDFRKWRGKIDVLTGGFPCQPFSYAGKRGGREDERYLWPQMLRAIDEIRPTWVVGENVAGITTMVEGGVLIPMGCDTTLFGEGDGLHRYELRESFTIERICKDLEGLGYSVQPMLIPAAAVGAPHRRDRILIIAHSDVGGGTPQGTDTEGNRPGTGIVPGKAGQGEGHTSVGVDGLSAIQGIIKDPISDGCCVGAHDFKGRIRDIRHAGSRDDERVRGEKRVHASDSQGLQRDGCFFDLEGELGRESACQSGNGCGKNALPDSYCERFSIPLLSGVHGKEEWDGEKRPAFLTSNDAWIEGTWWADFPTVSPVHSGNDGIPIPMDGITIPFTTWRTESLKAYGNAIVPQLMYRIFQVIETNS